MLPATMSDLRSALKRTQEFTQAASSDRNYLKMDKGGNWTFGADSLDVEKDDEWAINPASFFTGYNAFDADGKKQGEETSLMSEPPILTADLPHVNAAWRALIGVEVKCMKGEDEGQSAIISQSSRDGMKSLGKVLNEIMTRIDAADVNCVPVITLGSSKYRHKTYGVIYSADFEIVGWVSALGDEEEAAEEPKKIEKKSRKAKKDEAVEVVEAEVVEEVKEEIPAGTRRRRRAAS